VNYFSINSNPKMQGHHELLNPLVREAFNIAVDRAQIDSVAYLGEAIPAGNVIAKADGSWYDAALQPPPYNPALANQLLDKAGYKRGSNGVRMADGHPMAYQMVLYPTGGPETRIYQIIAGDFQKIGVQLTAITEDSAAATLSVYGQNNNYPTFQLQFSEWQPEVDPDFQLSVFLKSQWGGWNDSGFENPQYDNLYLEQGTATNQVARRAIVWKMETILYKDLPYVDIDYPEWVEAHDSAWTGFVMTGQGSFNELSDLTLLDVHRT
jgi:peptide/nickel transport system substrate-binding protein